MDTRVVARGNYSRGEAGKTTLSALIKTSNYFTVQLPYLFYYNSNLTEEKFNTYNIKKIMFTITS